MKIDFSDIDPQQIEHFKDGEGSVTMRAADDGKVRVMQVNIHPASSIGMHTHVGNSEIVRILSGEGYVLDDGDRYDLAAGSVTYCPEGKSHTIVNTGDEDLVLYAIVPKAPTE